MQTQNLYKYILKYVYLLSLQNPSAEALWPDQGYVSSNLQVQQTQVTVTRNEEGLSQEQIPLQHGKVTDPKRLREASEESGQGLQEPALRIRHLFSQLVRNWTTGWDQLTGQRFQASPGQAALGGLGETADITHQVVSTTLRPDILLVWPKTLSSWSCQGHGKTAWRRLMKGKVQVWSTGHQLSHVGAGRLDAFPEVGCRGVTGHSLHKVPSLHKWASQE